MMNELRSASFDQMLEPLRSDLREVGREMGMDGREVRLAERVKVLEERCERLRSGMRHIDREWSEYADAEPLSDLEMEIMIPGLERGDVTDVK